jgi:glycosyltransferase involved in cell wall biosynthesis
MTALSGNRAEIVTHGSVRPLRVALAVDARVTPEKTGGIAAAVGSLVQAFGKLEDGSEEFVVVVGSEEQVSWLGPLIGPNQRLVIKPQSRKERWLRPVRPAIRFLQERLTPPRYWPEVTISDGFYESLGCDVIHFPTQRFTVCAIRSVYNPIDLQHLHHPEFFDAGALAFRETMYRAGCNFAQAVIVNSNWIKADVVRQYRIDPGKIHVVQEAPATASSTEPSESLLRDMRARYGLEQRFLFYPGVTWPHKNHSRLFEALAFLRDTSGLRLQLVCTGSRDQRSWQALLASLRECALESQVKFRGHVPHDELRGLYRLATVMVLPSLFEANSLPIFEAWQEGTPVACSNATALPEQVGDAAMLFDPTDHMSIADAVAAIVSDPSLAAALRVKGSRRLRQFSWEQTARSYRAIYRSVAGRPLTSVDRRTLLDSQQSGQDRALEARV